MTHMSRTVGLVLLGGAALSTCCCLLRPPQPAPTRYDANGNPIPPAEGTAAGHTSRRHGSFWVPWYWGGTRYTSGYRPGPTYRPGGGASPVSPGGGVTRGGFGATGRSSGGGAIS